MHTILTVGAATVALVTTWKLRGHMAEATSMTGGFITHLVVYVLLAHTAGPIAAGVWIATSLAISLNLVDMIGDLASRGRRRQIAALDTGDKPGMRQTNGSLGYLDAHEPVGV